MAGQRIFAAAGLALALADPAAAAETRTPSPGRTIQVKPADLFVFADRLASGGNPQRAEQILELLSRDPDREVRNEARYRRSLLLEAKGSSKAAAVLLRTILEEKPDAAAVRLKLASMLHQFGDEEAALRELRALRSADLPPSVAHFVDRVSASLHASKPFGVQVEVALAPDSNINRATRSDSLGTIFGDFTFDQDSKQRSGVGVSVRGLVHRRVPLRSGISMVARVNSDLNLYRDQQFNDISAELSIGPEFRMLGTRFTAEAALGQRWYGMEPHQRAVRLSGTAARPLSAISQARLDASVRWSDNKVNDLQDGRGVTVRPRYERALSPRMFIAAGLTLDRFKARDDAYSTRSWSAALTVFREVGRTTVSIGGEIGRLKADERLQILVNSRKDKLTRLSLGAVFRHVSVAGFAPMTRITLERNRSTVEFYDYRRTRTEIGISRAF